jgi:two-component system chemotaxis response regulator CheY
MKALIVDDSRTMRLMIDRLLTGLGFETVQAADGSDALEVLRGTDLPDVALIDWNMPVMNGLELVTALRSDPATRRIALMMVTTESEQSQIVRALAAGAHEYLIKPFSPDALAAKLDMLGLLPLEATEGVR